MSYKGWFEQYKEIWQKQVGAKDAPKSVYQVALWLPTYVNRRTLDAYPAQDTLAKLTGRTEATVSHAIGWMEREGHLYVLRRFKDGGRKKVNRCTLLLQIGQQLTADPQTQRSRKNLYPSHIKNAAGTQKFI